MSPKYKITAEEKIKLVHAYLSGKITQRYAGEAAGVSHATIQVVYDTLKLPRKSKPLPHREHGKFPKKIRTS